MIFTPPTPEALDAWAAGNALAAERAAAEHAFDRLPKRPLTNEEIVALERQGNSSTDWAALRVTEDFLPDAIHHCRFHGPVQLGRFDPSLHLPESPASRPGLFASVVSASRIASGARVSHCDLVDRVFIGEGALLESIHRIALTGPGSAFGNHLELFVEGFYSRRLRAVADLPFAWAAWATSPDAVADAEPGPSAAAVTKTLAAHDLAESLAAACDRWRDRLDAPLAYVGPGATIRATPVVENAWIGSHVHIDAASALRDCTLHATAEEPLDVRDGARIREALIGPGCSLIDHCSVSRSLLTEHVQVGTQAIVKGSLVGPNARLAECEVNDSFLGPFTTAVHHGLVIAAWWPEGRGNVGYGANVGSNHTGRAPDQEIWPGEGLFFGLGCNIKFPCNFRDAPWSVVATGVDLLPQRIGFPCSLIALPGLRPEGVSPAFNEIHPGWNLLHSAYALERQEQNQRSRNRARRLAVEPVIFRRDFVARLDLARARLLHPRSGDRPFYTSAHFPELGKNFMTETARRDAIRAYELGLRLGAARVLLRALAPENDAASENAPDSPPTASAAASETAAASAPHPPSLHDLAEWAAPFLDAHEPDPLLAAAIAAERDWYRAVVASRDKDWKRGGQILDDYAARHLSPEQDPIIISLRERIERYEETAAELRSRLENAIRPRH